MDVIVWNSQGNKWDTLWTSYLAPIAPANQDLVGLIVESGWAPWVTSGDVVINNVYWLNTSLTYYDTTNAAASPFCQAVEAKRRARAYWVPWVANLDAMKTNTRCSMGAVLLPAKRLVESGTRYNLKKNALFRRPVFRFDVMKPNDTGAIPDFSVFLVHLVSGRPNKAQEEMDVLTKTMSTLIPQGSSALIVGDMNVDLQTIAINVPNNWRILNTGGATQQSGGELDYGLLYDPNGKFGFSTAAVVQQYKTGNNQSDHSVMRYTIPLS